MLEMLRAAIRGGHDEKKAKEKPKGIPPEPALAKAGAGMTRKKAKEKPNGIPDKISFCKFAKSDFSGMTKRGESAGFGMTKKEGQKKEKTKWDARLRGHDEENDTARKAPCCDTGRG